MSWQYNEYNVFGNQNDDSSLKVSRDVLRELADDFLGPGRSIDDLHPRDKDILLLEIEADMLDLDLALVPITSEHDPPKNY